MKNDSLLFVLTAVAFLLSCSENEKVTLLNIRVDGLPSEQIEYWIFVSDNAGKALGLQKCTPGNFVLSSDVKLQQVNITIFKKWLQYQSAYTADTYTEVPVGGTVVLTGPVSVPERIGTAHVTVTNCETPPLRMLATVTSSSYSNKGLIDQRYFNGIYDATFSLVYNQELLLMTVFRDGDPVYYLNEDLRPGDDVTTNLADFKPFDLVLNLDEISGRTAYSAGIREIDGQDFIFQISNIELTSFTPNPTPRRIGYVNGFDSYLTSISAV